jgi:hypothetical protein
LLLGLVEDVLDAEPTGDLTLKELRAAGTSVQRASPPGGVIGLGSPAGRSGSTIERRWRTSARR